MKSRPFGMGNVQKEKGDSKESLFLRKGERRVSRYELPIKVEVYCGHYVSGGSYFTEAPECGWEGVVEVEWDDFENGHASARCGTCGAELTQDMDSFERVEE